MTSVRVIIVIIMFKTTTAEVTDEPKVKDSDNNNNLNSLDEEISDVVQNSEVPDTEILTNKSTIIHKTNASNLKWPMGIVPYNIDTENYDKVISQHIRSAMRTIEASSCILFKDLKGESNEINNTWLYFTNPTNERECIHEPTYTENGAVIIILGYECLRRRDVLHTVLHALGFIDEVTHPQRDHYVRILWENLQPKYRPLFRIRDDEVRHKTIVEYDPMSVMHFHDRAFTANGGATIAPLIPGLLINPSAKLSQLDIMKLGLYFGAECNKRKVGDLLDTCKKIIYTSSKADKTNNTNLYQTVDDISMDKDIEITEEDSDEKSEVIKDSHDSPIK